MSEQGRWPKRDPHDRANWIEASPDVQVDEWTRETRTARRPQRISFDNLTVEPPPSPPRASPDVTPPEPTPQRSPSMTGLALLTVSDSPDELLPQTSSSVLRQDNGPPSGESLASSNPYRISKSPVDVTPVPCSRDVMAIQQPSEVGPVEPPPPPPAAHGKWDAWRWVTIAAFVAAIGVLGMIVYLVMQ